MKDDGGWFWSDELVELSNMKTLALEGEFGQMELIVG